MNVSDIRKTLRIFICIFWLASLQLVASLHLVPHFFPLSFTVFLLFHPFH